MRGPQTTIAAGPRLRVASPVTALVLAGVLLALMIADVPFSGLARQSLNSSGGSAPVWFSAAFGAVGFVVAWRKPRNPLGWLLLGGAVFLALSEDASFYTVADYRLRSGGLPLGWVAVLAQPGWALGIVFVGLAILLFPDGLPPSSRWRSVLWVYLAVAILYLAGAAVVTVGASPVITFAWIPVGTSSCFPIPLVLRRGGVRPKPCSSLCWQSAGWVRWWPRWPATGARPESAGSS